MIFQNALLKSLHTHQENTAIDNNGISVSYSELIKKSDKITSFLLKQNLEPETIVGLSFDSKESLIYSMIGALNARCTIVPIDISMPEKRLQMMADEMNLQYLITSEKNSSLGKTIGIAPFLIEDIFNSENEEDIQNIKYPAFDNEDSIYIYFTSGSTGKPKGIIGKNNSLLQFLNWEIQEFNIDSNTKVSQLIHPYFDAFLRDIFVPLLSGGTICIPPVDEDFFTPEKLTKWIEASGVNLIHCVPSLFRIINNDQLTSESYLELKNVLLSGEKINPAELKKWYDLFRGRIQLTNLYGATETTMIRFFYHIMPEDANLSKISIGKPIADTDFFIADKNLKKCSPFVIGNLYIISDYMTKGYLNEPELNNEKFVLIDAGNGEKKRAFKTGDKARVMPNGAIDLMGREDNQIKINGIRIETDGIENTLISSGVLKNAVVFKHPDGEFLISFVIPSENTQGLEEMLKKHLEANLPSYMIPSDVIQIDHFPLLDNGKINFKELLQSVTKNDIVAPANEIEDRLLKIWKEILGEEKEISTASSFHNIGGNSLAIMRLIGKIYKEYNVRFSLSELFNNLTIIQQAQYIKASGKDNTLIIQKAEPKDSYKLSAAQERIYYNYELNKQSKAFNLPMIWKIEGSFNEEKLTESINNLIKRHESLRTEFRFIGGEIRQIIKDKVDFSLEIIHTDENIDNEITAFIRPFILDAAPLFRCGIIYSRNETYIIVDLHHIVCDGMSQNNLFSDLMKLYNDEQLPLLPLQYKDYSEWEHAFRHSNDYISHREFWLKMFEGNIPDSKFPVSDENIGHTSDSGGTATFKIDIQTIKKVTESLKTEEITTFSSLFSMFFLYLSQFTGQEDLVIGINSSGRLQDELEDVVGMFTKTLPIRYCLNENMAFGDFAKEVHQVLVQAHSSQIYDLADMVKEINNNRNIAVKQLFDVMFVFQNFEAKKVGLQDIQLSAYEFENKTYKYPITLFASEGDDAMYFRMEYSALNFTAGDIEIIIRQFQDLILKISENIDKNLIDYFDNELAVLSLDTDEINFNF